MNKEAIDAIVVFEDGSWHDGYIHVSEISRLLKVNETGGTFHSTVVLKDQKRFNKDGENITVRDILVKQQDLRVRKSKGLL